MTIYNLNVEQAVKYSTLKGALKYQATPTCSKNKITMNHSERHMATQASQRNTYHIAPATAAQSIILYEIF